jgi:hypothetical protein
MAFPWRERATVRTVREPARDSEETSMRLPKAILPIVEVLRAEARPRGELEGYYPPVSLPGMAPMFLPRFKDRGELLCPMGFLPGALSTCPFAEDDFAPGKGLKEHDIRAFGLFWDSLPLDKAEKVAREIWPDFGSV